LGGRGAESKIVIKTFPQTIGVPTVFQAVKHPLFCSGLLSVNNSNSGSDK
jgi:hypothetical protein